MESVEQAILAIARAAAPGESFSPSEVALKLDAVAWRSKLSAVRRAALRMAARGEIEVLRKGKAVEAAQEIRGVIRLRLKPQDGEIG